MNEFEIEKENNIVETMKNLQSDCPYCREKAEVLLRNRTMAMEEWHLAETEWDCPICETHIDSIFDVLPLTPETKWVKERNEQGYYVDYNFHYDSYLCFDTEERSSELCDDKNCEFCSIELDWKEMKEHSYDWHMHILSEEDYLKWEEDYDRKMREQRIKYKEE
jgi:hypothetical protein